MKKKVSVVIIGKNEEKNILRCITSVKNTIEYMKRQIETVYIDSGSNDNTILNITTNHSDVKIFRISDVEIKTASKGRHLGALVCEGEYILFLDADMEIHNRFLTNILSIADDNSEFIGGIGIRNDIFLSEGIRVKTHANVYNTFEETDCRHFGGALFIKKDFLIRIGNYGSAIVANEEAELHSRILKNGKNIKEYPFEMINHYIYQEENKKSWKNLLFGSRNQGIGQGFRHSMQRNSTLNFIRRFDLFFLTLAVDITSLVLILVLKANFYSLLVTLLTQLILGSLYVIKGKLKFYILNRIYAIHFFKGVLNYGSNNQIEYTQINNLD
ncbi:MAG: glycosyltransferase [Exiguobacterium chiriqhucha]|uniref:glycosyltransferase n=1 Tax=Exiguobacterium chiriqhucha TaxID=1385984 RepID=UPI00144F660F|nr:glycosyltransferase [Exiguobacterium chiriqhucha]KAB2865288.1 MAG: glycosyltransferase [Exiguobacterium chiriqhucha]